MTGRAANWPAGQYFVSNADNNANSGTSPETSGQMRQGGLIGVNMPQSSSGQTPPRIRPGAILPSDLRGGRLAKLKTSTRQVDGVTIVDLSGRITLGEASVVVRDVINDLMGKGNKKVLLNLGEVDYIDSSGVGELVSCFTTVRNAGGELKLLSLTQKVQDVLHVTKLYTVFDIKDDEFTAVKSFDYFFAK